MPNGYDAWECRMGGTLMDSPLQSQARQRPGRAPGWQGGGGGQLQAFPKSHGKGALATPGKEKNAPDCSVQANYHLKLAVIHHLQISGFTIFVLSSFISNT